MESMLMINNKLFMLLIKTIIVLLNGNLVKEMVKLLLEEMEKETESIN